MDELRSKLTTLHQEKEYYRRELLAAEAREAALRVEKEQLTGEIASLAKQNAALQRLYDEMRSAFWWRVTGPLRRLTDALRPQKPEPAPAIEAKPDAEAVSTGPVFEAVADGYRGELPDEPLVSILIPNRDHMEDLSLCIESIFSRSSYRKFEIIIAENGSFTDTIFRYYENVQRQWDNVRVVTWDGPFNYAAINNFAAREARGEYLLLLNNDMEVISPHWLEEMLLLARREEVGAVGAMLYFPGDTIQHAGMSVTADHPNRHVYRDEPRGIAGEGGELLSARYVDAVTGACLMLRRGLWEELRGLDETFEVAFNDVDLCLRLREKGYRSAFTPFAELYHNESRSRGFDDSPEKTLRFQNEMQRFRMRWLGN